jgi:hypothetical protein
MLYINVIRDARAERALLFTFPVTRYCNYAKVSSIRRPPASSEPRDGGQAPGVLHHVMGRGIERRKIFLNTKDREDFIARLKQLADDRSMFVYAWTLLENHFHLLCKTKNRPLSSSMRKLLTGYVVNFNPA